METSIDDINIAKAISDIQTQFKAFYNSLSKWDHLHSKCNGEFQMLLSSIHNIEDKMDCVTKLNQCIHQFKTIITTMTQTQQTCIDILRKLTHATLLNRYL